MENDKPEKADPQREQPETSRENAGAPPDRKPGEAYIPLPDLPAPAPRRRWLAAAGLLALAAITGAYFKFKGPLPSTAPVPPSAVVAGAVRESKVFLVGMRDLDEARTIKARELLKAGLPAKTVAAARKADGQLLPMPARRSGPARSAAPLQAPGPAGSPAAAAVPAPEFQPAPVEESRLAEELAAMPQSIQNQVRDGSMGLFTFRFVDFVAEDGDIVDVAVDGQLIGRVTLSHQGAELTIPLKPKETHTITITAVFDGGGGVTFGAVSSVGNMRTRVMAVGETETWTVNFPSGGGDSAAGNAMDGFLKR